VGEAGGGGGEADIGGGGKRPAEEILALRGHPAGRGAADLEAAAAGPADDDLAAARSKGGGALGRAFRGAGAASQPEGGVGGRDGGFPLDGEDRASALAAAHRRAVEPGLASGEAGIAGAAEGLEEQGVLGGGAGGEGAHRSSFRIGVPLMFSSEFQLCKGKSVRVIAVTRSGRPRG
jgi:hypothetical protein